MVPFPRVLPASSVCEGFVVVCNVLWCKAFLLSCHQHTCVESSASVAAMILWSNIMTAMYSLSFPRLQLPVALVQAASCCSSGGA